MRCIFLFNINIIYALKKNGFLNDRYNETVNDQALMYLSTVCNYQRENNVTDDIITIVLDVKVEDNPELITGEKEWISAGNQYSDTKIWVGQLALYAQRTGTIIPVRLNT